MPRVIIVDDEETIRCGLEQLISRLLPEWDVVQSFPDAETALSGIEEADPDLAIIDISMTGMSGLELTERLEQMRPELYKIILTGHEKFDFLQTAMRCGVTDYLLKPLQRDELVQAFRKVETALQERQQQTIVQLEKLLLEWFVSQSPDRFAELLQAYEQKLGERQALQYCVLVLLLEDQGQGIDRVHMDLVRRHLERGSSGTCDVAGIVVAEACVLFLVCGVELPPADSWKRIVGQIVLEQAAVPRSGLLLSDIGCSEPFADLVKLGQAYDQAVKGMSGQHGAGRSAQAGEEWMRQLTLSIETNDAEKTVQLLRGWAGDIKAAALQQPSRMAMYGFQMIGFLTGPALGAIPSRLAERLLQSGAVLSEQLPAALTPSLLMQSIDSFLETLDLRAPEEQGTRKVILKVQQLIRASYADPELNLEMLAQRVYLHPTYLSELFKETTGQKFIDYLTDVRMEEARRILRETDLKMYEVAEAVGYTSPKYFSTLFRKHFQLTPMSYRERAH